MNLDENEGRLTDNDGNIKDLPRRRPQELNLLAGIPHRAQPFEELVQNSLKRYTFLLEAVE